MAEQQAAQGMLVFYTYHDFMKHDWIFTQLFHMLYVLVITSDLGSLDIKTCAIEHNFNHLSIWLYNGDL